MDFCTNCGEKLNESSRFCTNSVQGGKSYEKH